MKKFTLKDEYKNKIEAEGIYSFAQKIGVSYQSVYNLIESNTSPIHKIRKAIAKYFNKEVLEIFNIFLTKKEK